MPVMMSRDGFGSVLLKFSDTPGRERIIFIPKKIRMPAPKKEISFNIQGVYINLASPRTIKIIMIISASAWPRIMIGPDLNPCFALSEITAARKGPGMSAPERAMTKEMKNIEIRFMELFYNGIVVK